MADSQEAGKVRSCRAACPQNINQVRLLGGQARCPCRLWAAWTSPHEVHPTGGPERAGRSTLPPARRPTPSLVSSSVCLRAAMPRRLGSQPSRLYGLRAPRLRMPPSVRRAGSAPSPHLLRLSRSLLLAAEAGR